MAGLPRTSLRGFLGQAKNALQAAQTRKSPLTFVIGNESADLDSISCALVYSFIQSISTIADKRPSLHIPLLNIPKADIALRPELLALLPKVDLDEEQLLTLDDLGDLSTIETRLLPSDTRWILVDHNSMESHLGAIYGKRVVGVIDHHVDEHKVPQDTGAEPRIITVTGSCASLVVNHLRDAWDRHVIDTVSDHHGEVDSTGSETSTSKWSSQVAQVALASILVDTADLKDKHKVTDHDTRAVDFLEDKIGLDAEAASTYSRDGFWKELQHAKEDLEALSIRDILRKDYKAWKDNGLTLGTGSVVRSMDYLQRKATVENGSKLVDHCINYAKDQKLDLLAVLTAHTDEDGTFRRELLLLHAGGERPHAAVTEFQRLGSAKLELTAVDDGDIEGWHYTAWTQDNVAASRKQVAPLLREAMQATKSSL